MLLGEHEDERIADGSPCFRAFVSYSHADAKAARRLQRRLETYRVPRRLADRVVSLGEVRGRVGAVFRDREDLPASVDLSEAVKAAIARSRALIVLCSPDAARSLWVGREVELFRAVHPDRPVLAALIAGTPEQSFPPALRAGGAEPVAADFRQVGDGPRLAFLKVVAGILGVSLDELIQRDAQRRQRRVTAVTIAALAAMLFLSVMTLLAVNARREAERRRAEAEGLVEYMLTDLRQRLQAVGRLDIMGGVNRRAMAYYASEGRPDTLPDESLERRARVIGAMGEDAENGGDLDLAQARYEVLHRTTAALVAKHPGDPSRIFAHAQSENRLALLAVSRNRLPEATRMFRRTQQQLSSIADWGRARPEWLRMSGFARGNICAAMLKAGRSAADALRDCREAVRYGERRVAMSPGDTTASYDLVFHYLWLAEAQLEAGQAAAGRRIQARYLDLTRRMIARDPENMLWREQQMEVYVRHAELLRTSGEAEAATRFLEEARDIDERLIRRDPDNAVWSGYRTRISRALNRRQDHGPE